MDVNYPPDERRIDSTDRLAHRGIRFEIFSMNNVRREFIDDEEKNLGR